MMLSPWKTWLDTKDPQCWTWQLVLVNGKILIQMVIRQWPSKSVWSVSWLIFKWTKPPHAKDFIPFPNSFDTSSIPTQMSKGTLVWKTVLYASAVLISRAQWILYIDPIFTAHRYKYFYPFPFQIISYHSLLISQLFARDPWSQLWRFRFSNNLTSFTLCLALNQFIFPFHESKQNFKK